MPTSTRYFQDWTTPETNVRWRLICTPQTTVRINLAGAFTAGELAWGSPPAFGGASAAGWKALPPGTIYAPKMPEVGFGGGLPVGYMEPPTLDFVIHTQRLAGDSDLEDFRGYVSDIFYFDLPYAGYVTPAPAGEPSIEVATDVFRGINTTLFWIWLTDDGDSSLAVGSFRVAFEGGHDRSTTSTHETNLREGNTVISLRLVHILWLAAASVIPEDLKYRIPSMTTTTERYLWDVVWWGTAGYARVLGSNPNDSDYDVHTLATVESIWAQIRALIEAVYRLFARYAVTLTFTEAKGPLGRLALREQSQTVANTAAAAVSSPQMVVGISGFVSTTDDRGGWLSSIGGTDGTLFAYETLDQLLIAVSEGCVQKASVRYSAIGAMVLTDYGITTGFASLAITVDSDWRGHTLVVGEGTITGADAEIEGSQEGDQQNIEHRLIHLREISNWTVPVPIHNQPHIGPISDVWYSIFARGGFDWQVVGSQLVTCNCLWYTAELKQAAGAGVGTNAVMRVHHKVGITDGATTYDECTDGISLPNPGTLAGVGGAPWLNDLWYPLRDAMLLMQQNGCLPTAAVRRMTGRFGDKKQTLYPGDVEATVAGVEQLGRRVESGWSSGQTLTGETFHSTIPGSPILISTSLDEATGRASVKLLALGGT